MAVVELSYKRTATAKHFLDLDTGQKIAYLYTHDVHYQDETGNWQDTGEVWENDGADGFDFGMNRLRHRVRLVQLTGVCRYHPVRNALLKYVTLGRPQRKGIGQLWPDMLLGTRSQDANWMHFDTADHGYDLLSTWRQVEQLYRLKDASAPTRIRLPWTFNNLTFDYATREIRDGAVVVAHVQPTVAWDATGANVPLTESWDGSYLEINLSVPVGFDWATQGPVTIDPTFTDGYGGDVNTAIDTYLYVSDPDWPMGSEATIRFQQATYHTLMKFDFTGLPEARTTTSATISVYQVWANETINATLKLHRVHANDSGWIEGATWNYANPTTVRWAGDTGNDGGADAGCSVSGTDYIATELASVALTGPYAADEEIAIPLDVSEFDTMVTTNNGLVGWVVGAKLDARSSDYGTTGLRPKLVVVYTEAGATVHNLMLLGVG